MRAIVAIALLVSLTACGRDGDVDTAATTGRLRVGEVTMDLVVTACATFGGRFMPNLPVEGAETTLTATGRTGAGEPVDVVVRRTRSSQAPQLVQSVEIGIGDPERAIEALVLYRAYDEDTGQWTSIDPDAATTRVDAAGPLLALTDGEVRANGVARRAATGEPVDVQLRADCPLDLDDGPGLADARPERLLEER